MPTDKEVKTARSWLEVAAEASKEPDPEKLLQLSKELCQLLDARDKKAPVLQDDRTHAA
jgi:hypothetical protein